MSSGVGKRGGLDHSLFSMSLSLLQNGEAALMLTVQRESTCTDTHLISILD